MRAFFDVPPNVVSMVLRISRRRPNRLLTAAATVRATNHAPTMPTRRFDDRPTFALGVLQRRLNLFVGMFGQAAVPFPLLHQNGPDRITRLL